MKMTNEQKKDVFVTAVRVGIIHANRGVEEQIMTVAQSYSVPPETFDLDSIGDIEVKAIQFCRWQTRGENRPSWFKEEWATWNN